MGRASVVSAAPLPRCEPLSWLPGPSPVPPPGAALPADGVIAPDAWPRLTASNGDELPLPALSPDGPRSICATRPGAVVNISSVITGVSIETPVCGAAPFALAARRSGADGATAADG